MFAFATPTDHQSRGGCRYGAFFKDVPDGMLLSAGRSIAAGDGFNRTAGGVYEVGLRWKANPREGVGWLMFRAGEYRKLRSFVHA